MELSCGIINKGFFMLLEDGFSVWIDGYCDSPDRFVCRFLEGLEFLTDEPGG